MVKPRDIGLRLAAAIALAVAHGANASSTTAKSCHGCTASQLAAKALSAPSGTAYIYNNVTRSVTKYTIYFEFDDGPGGGGASKVALPVPVEASVQTSYEEYVDAFEDAASIEEVVLPPDFPITSVAYFLSAPDYSSTAIEDHLNSLPPFELLGARVALLLQNWATANIPFANISGAFGEFSMTIEFAEGDSIEVDIELVGSPIPGENYEVEIAGYDDARLPDGTPVPTSPITWDGFDISGPNVEDWLHWAQQNGVSVVGSPGPGQQGCATSAAHCEQFEDENGGVYYECVRIVFDCG